MSRTFALRCLLFAGARDEFNAAKGVDAPGTDFVELFDVPEGTTAVQLLQLLRPHFRSEGSTFELDSCALAVNEEYVAIDESVILKAGDEVALIPPVSGG